jgi:hypothetical protein
MAFFPQRGKRLGSREMPLSGRPRRLKIDSTVRSPGGRGARTPAGPARHNATLPVQAQDYPIIPLEIDLLFAPCGQIRPPLRAAP